MQEKIFQNSFSAFGKKVPNNILFQYPQLHLLRPRSHLTLLFERSNLNEVFQLNNLKILVFVEQCLVNLFCLKEQYHKIFHSVFFSSNNFSQLIRHAYKELRIFSIFKEIFCIVLTIYLNKKKRTTYSAYTQERSGVIRIRN